MSTASISDEAPGGGGEIPDGVRFAVVFKTYGWDAFIERRARACADEVGHGDFFISVDETNGRVGPIPFPRVISTSNAELTASGLPDRFEEGSLLWWNPDYVHYQFRAKEPNYDFYIFVEYDAVVYGGFGNMVAKAAAERIDFVGLPIRTEKRDWYWSLFLEQTYELAELEGVLICVSLFSARALDLLNRRRREMAGKCPYWPSSEGFLLTEVRKAGFRFASLAEFGDVSSYDWSPPMLEQSLIDRDGMAFLHPVLDNNRYIASMLKSTKTIRSFFNPGSPMRRSLSQFPPEAYKPRLLGAAVTRARTNVREFFSRLRVRVARSGRARARTQATSPSRIRVSARGVTGAAET